MTDIKISDLTSLSSVDIANADLIPVVDSSTSLTKSISYIDLKSAIISDAGYGTNDRLFVASNGSDFNTGQDINSPLLTLSHALTLVNENGVILIGSGTFTEVAPMIMPRNVSIVGSGLRVTTIKPTVATNTQPLFKVDSGAYLTGMTFANHQAGGWAVAFNENANNTSLGAADVGAYILKSPYIQNCTSYTAEDDSGVAGSTSDGTTGGGMLIDGDSCASNSPIRSMVVDSFTQINLDGPGCLATNNAYAQLVSFFGTFCSYHVKAINGAQVNLSNSTTDFGTYGLVADGRSTTAIFSGTSGAASIGDATIEVTSLSSSTIGSSNKPTVGQVFDVGSETKTVTGAVSIAGGYSINFYPPFTSAHSSGSAISFFQRSQISTSGHTMEYVGAGTNYTALPYNGGVPVPANEINELNGGRVFFSTTDQNGTLRVGHQFSVDGTTGSVTISADEFNLSGLNAIGPFSRDGGFSTVGVQLLEVSNNANLEASTGTADGNTAPTQYAVKTWTEANFLQDIVGDVTPQLGGNLDLNGNDIVTTSNGNITLNPNGSGIPVITGNSTRGSGQLKLNCELNTHAVILKGPAHSAAADYTFTLPQSMGTSGQILSTDGTDTVSWINATSSYSNNNVDAHLNVSGASSNYFLQWSGADYQWVGISASYDDAAVNTHLNTSTATTGQVLSWDGADYDWISAGTYANTDVDTHLNTSAAATSQVLSWNGSDYAWITNGSGGGGATVISDLTDVTISTASTGQVLSYNGSAWVNGAVIPTTGTIASQDASSVAITGGDITAIFTETPTTIATGASSIICDLSTSNFFVYTSNSATDAATVSITNPPTSGTAQGFTLEVNNVDTDALAITWPSAVDWSGGTAPANPAAGETDVYVFYTRDGGTTYKGFHVGDNMT